MLTKLRRRQAQRRLKSKRDEAPLFVPAVVEQRVAARPKHRKKAVRLTREADRRDGVIEVETGGITVRIGRGADTKLATAVVMALKAGK